MFICLLTYALDLLVSEFQFRVSRVLFLAHYGTLHGDLSVFMRCAAI